MAIDIDQSHYNTGTATVAANGTAVTGQGTTWAGAVRKGDLFGTHKGDGIRILSVDSNTALTLAYPWPGGAQTAAAYEIQRTPYDVGYLQAIEDIIRLYGIGNLPALAGLDGTGGDKLIKLTGAGTAEAFAAKNLISLAALDGTGGNKFPRFTGAGALDVRTAAQLLGDIGAQSSLGYTPVNKAGDTGIGPLGLAGLLTTNGQVKFPASQNPSSDANTNDDYEEGTFSPDAINNTSTWAIRAGNYQKVGNTVRCWVRFDGGVSGSAGPVLYIASGLPYPIKSGLTFTTLGIWSAALTSVGDGTAVERAEICGDGAVSWTSTWVGAGRR